MAIEQNVFEAALKDHPLPSEAGKAMIHVADTAYFCRLWLQAYGGEFKTSDIMAMTAMVLQRDRASIRGRLNLGSLDLTHRRDRGASEQFGAYIYAHQTCSRPAQLQNANLQSL